jgi:acid phosphatase
MFPNPNCYKLRLLAKQFNKTVSNMMQDKFESLSIRLKNYVDDVSLDSHPSANGILGKKKKNILFKEMKPSYKIYVCI